MWRFYIEDLVADIRYSMKDGLVAVAVDVYPLGDSPIVRYRKWIRNGCV